MSLLKVLSRGFLRGDQDKLRGHKGSRTIRGEVLSVEGDIYYLQEQNGKAVRLHTDQTTKKIGNIHAGTSRDFY